MAFETGDDTIKVGLDTTDFEGGERRLKQSAERLSESLKKVARDATDNASANKDLAEQTSRAAAAQEIAERHARNRAEADARAAEAARRFAEANGQVAEKTERTTSSTIALASGIGALVGTMAGGLLQGAMQKMGEFIEMIGSGATQAAIESIDSMTKMEAMISATGGSAGRTKAQLEAMAQSVASTTRNTDEQARAAISTLMKFSTVSGDVFDRSVKLSTDLAVIMGGDMASAANAIGRALESPVHGMQMLHRQGIMIPPMLRDQIKELEASGHHYEAQEKLLSALEGRTRGLAEAMNNNLGGSFAALNKEWGELIEAIGSGQGRVERQIALWGTMRDIVADIRKYLEGKEGSTTENVVERTASSLVKMHPSLALVWNIVSALSKTNKDLTRPLASTDGGVAAGDDDSVNAGMAATAKETEAATRAMDAYRKIADATKDSQSKMRDELGKLLVAWRNLTPEQREQAGGAAAIQREIGEVTKKYQTKTKAVKEAGDADAHYNLWLKEQAKLQASVAKALADGIEEQRKREQALDDEIEKQRQAVATYGMARSEIEGLTIARLEERLEMERASGAMDADLTRLQNEIDKRKELQGLMRQGEGQQAASRATNEALREQMGLWDQLGNMVGGFFSAMVDGTASAVDYMKRMLKSLLADIIGIFAKKWILQMGASMMGGTAGQALAGQAASVGQGSISGMLGNMMSSAGSSIMGWMGSGIASAGTALFGAGSSMTGIGLGISSAASGGIWSSAAAGAANLASGATSASLAIGQMIPAIGIVVTALYFLARALQKPGGPKVEGSYFGAFSDTGTSLGSRALTAGMGYGEHAPTMWRTNEAGGTAQQWVEGIAAAYYQTVGRMGGTGQAFNFGGGIVTDPRGTAPSFVHSLLTGSGGQVIANFRNDSVGRSDEELQAEMKLQTMRMLVAALRESSLPSQVAAVFDAIDIDSATLEQLESAVAAATEIADVLKGLESLTGMGLKIDFDSLKGFQRAGETLTDTFNRVADGWSFFVQNFMPEAEVLKLATAELTAGFAAIGMAVPKTVEEFYNTVMGLDLTTEAGRTAYEAMMRLAPAFLQVSEASAQATAQLNANLAQLRSINLQSGGASSGQAGLQIATEQFMASASWTRGMGWQYVADQLRTITEQDFANYSSEQQARIIAIRQMLLSQDQAASGAAKSFGDFTDSARDAADALKQMKESLRDWALGKILGDTSSLSPDEKMARALDEYERVVAAKDVGSFQGVADILLALGRENFSSSERYKEIFARVMKDAETLGGFDLGFGGATETNRDFNKMREDIVAELRSLRISEGELKIQVAELIKAVKEGAAKQAEASADAAEQTKRAIIGAVEAVVR